MKAGMLTCGLPACTTPVPTIPEQRVDDPTADAGPSGPRIEVSPQSGLDAASRVLRIALHFDSPVAPSRALLFAGTVTSAQLREVRKGNLSAVLAERLEPVEAWRSDDPSLVVVRPLSALLGGSVHTLALDRPAYSTTFVIKESDPMPLLRRVWPQSDVFEAPKAFVIYCGQEALAPIARDDTFEPSGQLGRWIGGVGASFEVPTCVRWTAYGGSDGSRGYPAVAPPLLALDDDTSVELEPFVMRGGARSDAAAPLPSQTPVSCPSAEAHLGLGCAVIEDDRLLVTPLAGPALWVFEHRAVMNPSTNARFVIKRTSGEERIRSAVVDPSGNLFEAEILLPPFGARPHLVINEVYADALGPEPAQEWVEIVNDGGASVSLAGYRLEDAAGSSVLPGVDLDAGQYAMIVREDFVENDGVDPPVSPTATLLRVPQLGGNGLSNSGETLLLRNPAGEVVSRFPALPAHSGISNVRFAPELLDEDPASFGPSPKGTATPGAPNR